MTACDRRESDCACNRVGRHTIHRCECGGSWVYDAQGQMVPRSWPGGDTNLWAAMDRLLDPLGFLR